MIEKDSLNGFGLSEQEPRPSYPLKTVILAGGRGERLSSITGGLVPKCFVNIDGNSGVRGIDWLDEVFKNLNLTDVVFSADFYYNQYKEFIKRVGRYSIIRQKDNVGNGGAVE